MKTPQLKGEIARLEQELDGVRKQLAHATHDPRTLAAELAKSRAYAFDANTLSVEEMVEGCAGSLDSYGFCVVENVIPAEEVPTIRQEILEAETKVNQNLKAIKDLTESEGLNDQELLANDKVLLRPVGRAGRPPKPPNDVVWMPEYARYLANPRVTAVARHVLDDHLRIASLHSKALHSTSPDDTSGSFSGYDLFGLPRLYGGGANTREWHTDWPHDLSAYGGDNPDENAGCLRQPFPDIAMCLVMIFFLTDVDESSGGTWIVPGSHRDKRNPRGPSDEITVSAPIPGEMQVTAPAGSVFIQDSRTWHSAPMHNFSNQKRVAVVSRWCPWWLSVNDFAPGSRYNVICRPLSHSEYLALPTELQPLMRHLCSDELDVIQPPILDRAKAAALRAQWGYRQLEENPDNQAQANEHIRVPLLTSKK
jgi:ectoine hydroxylase-related dioxygenase (phytanoyl-CoA dioxygenase family)